MGNLIDYINWEQIVAEHNLKTNELNINDWFAIEKMIANYIEQNK